MSTSMTLSHFFLLLPLLFLVEITSTFSPNASSHDPSVSLKPRGIILNLIHRNSVLSPYYNPNATQWDLTREAVVASLARARSYSQIITAWKNGGSIEVTGDVPVVIDRGYFLLAKIFVAYPTSKQFLFIDTGSSLTWTHCKPCLNCPKQKPELFDPKKSLTYSSIPCKGDQGSKPCEALGGVCDDSGNPCSFNIKYADGRNIAGEIAKENLAFGGSNVIVPFGCAHSYIKGQTATDQVSGILGLGLGSSSILDLFGRKLSHCFGDIADPNYQYHKLFLGEAAKFYGPSIPFVILNGHYYVDLEGISFGGNKLDIKDDAFKLDTRTGYGGTVLDSGSPVIFLKRDAYVPLALAVKNYLELFYEKYPVQIGQYWRLCYKGTLDKLFNVAVTLHFNGGVQIVLDKRSYLKQLLADGFCMAVGVTEELMGDAGPNIIGAFAQQFYNVGFDGNSNKVYFQKADCKNLQG